MSDDGYDPLLKRKLRPPTEAEMLAWRELSRDPTEFWKVPLDPYPYVRLAKRGIGIEVGIKGTFR